MDFPDFYNSCDVDNGHSAARIIYDEPVVCRAKATLPSKYLYFKHSKTKKGIGVFARKEISFKTLFGPLEGVMGEDDESRNPKRLHYLVEVDGSFKRLDTSNEFLSNWMRYVKAAKTYREQNLALHQQGKNLYFSTTRGIKAKEELKVWYSCDYALPRKIRTSFGNDHRIEEAIPKTDEWSIDCMEVDYQPLLNDLDFLWSCTHCLLKFKSATLLNFHMLAHAADNIETSSQIDLSHEELSFDAINLIGQPHLDQVSANMGDALSHQIAENSSKIGKTFECPICNEIFDKLVSLKQHVHSHSVNGSFTCPTCSKSFRTYKHARNHIRIYHSLRRFQCDVCPKRFPTQNKLKHHKLRHTGHKPYLCSECGKQFKRRDKLNDHIKRTHEEGTSFNKCRKPPKEKKGKLDASSEIAVESPYKCQVCTAGFKRRGMLVNHLASRHPDVPFESIDELRLPIVMTDKEYLCQYCDRVYKSTSKRKSHILKHHPGKEVPAGERKLKLVENANNPEEEKASGSLKCGSYTILPHQCDWCHKQYASRAKLLQHQRKKHLDLMPKSLQEPKKHGSSRDEEFEDHDIGKVDDGALLLQNPLEENLSEYEFHLSDSKLTGEGEFIIDAPTLRKVLKGDAVSYECSPETLIELGQILDTRSDQYFRILQTPNGISFARPIEVWDPCQSLSPETPNGESEVITSCTSNVKTLTLLSFSP